MIIVYHHEYIIIIIIICLITQLCLTLRSHGLYIACQAPLSVGFPRQEYWSGLPFHSPGDLPDQENGSPSLQADSLPSEPPGKPTNILKTTEFYTLKWLRWCILCYMNFISIKHTHTHTHTHKEHTTNSSEILRKNNLQSLGELILYNRLRGVPWWR